MSHEYPALPLRELPRGRFAVRKEHLLAEIERPPRLSRRARVVLVAAVSLVVLGTAAAATTSWLTGRPAPPAVVSDFGSYTPQLGFHPEPGRAVLVAEDGAVSLYATTNREGTYCLVVSAPWKRPETLPDGGTCIPAAEAAAPVVAGLVGSAGRTFVIAGRVDAGAANAIAFTDPDGRLLTRPIGSSGFFVAAVLVSGSSLRGRRVEADVRRDGRARQRADTRDDPARPSGRIGRLCPRRTSSVELDDDQAGAQLRREPGRLARHLLAAPVHLDEVLRRHGRHPERDLEPDREAMGLVNERPSRSCASG
jgi:hypothetical protein